MWLKAWSDRLIAEGCNRSREDDNALMRATRQKSLSGNLSHDPIALMKLPPEERTRILAKAAAEAEDEYRHNSQLTDFNAFADGDFYDETT